VSDKLPVLVYGFQIDVAGPEEHEGDGDGVVGVEREGDAFETMDGENVAETRLVQSIPGG
jgi:hypothetical protein